MLAALGALGVFAQLSVVVHTPDTAESCQAIDVIVVARSAGRVVPTVAAPAFSGFDLLRYSARPYVQRTADGATTAEYRYTLATDQPGRYVLAPFVARIDGSEVRSGAVPLIVRPPRGRGSPAVVARARVDTSPTPDVLASIGSRTDTVYVGQQATYEVAVFLNGPLRERLRHNPTFYPPDMQAMLAYDLPTTPTSRRVGSRCFDALVYRRALFPLAPGRITIPPAQLVYRTSQSPYLFRAEESHELETDSVSLVAIEPPIEGRPAEYTGAVGRMQLDAQLENSEPRVGDPMLLTVRVTGSGNVKLFPRPKVQVPWAGLVVADERVAMDSASPRVEGVKEFDWVLTPRVAGEFDLPPIRYGYFDPARRAYGVAVASGSRLRVRDGTLASSDTGDVRPVLGIRHAWRGPSRAQLHSSPAFWLALALVPIPAIVTRTRNRQRRVVTPKVDPLRALTAASRADDPVALRRHFVRALAMRLACNAEDFTHPGALERALRRAGVSDETAGRAEALLRELDAAAYARAGAPPRGVGLTATAIVKAVDVEALSRTELPFWANVVAGIAVLGIVGAAMAADTASAQFSRGVSAYLRGEYAMASDAFAAAVNAQPASTDAWANFGTASYMAHDTASAMLGWRQALSLDPVAGDVRAMMVQTRGDGPGAPGWVPPVPRDLVPLLFALFWLGAWTLMYLAHAPRTRSRFSWAQRWPLPVAATALVVGVMAIETETRIAGERLGVVRAPVALSSDPAMGLDRGPMIGTGEIVHVAARRGGWARIEATAGREGWVAASALYLLDERRVPRD